MPLGAFKAALMGTAGVSAGADVVLLSSQTLSAAGTCAFASGITSAYGEYIFKWYDIHSTDSNGPNFTVNFSTDGGDNYNMTKTSTTFMAYHTQADASALSYKIDIDITSATGYQNIIYSTDSGADESTAGELHLFNPASTTYVKHWWSKATSYSEIPGVQNVFTGGYVNSTSDVDAVQFKTNVGTFSGKMKMWGVK